MTRVRLIAAVAAGLLALGLHAPAAAQQHYVMKLGTATLHDPQEDWMNRFKKLVEADSKGRIEVQVYPAGQLGSIPREIEDTQFGAIQGWVGPPEFLLGVDPRYQILGTPGLFTSFPQMRKTLDDAQVKRVFLDLGAEKGIKGLSIWVAGRNVLFTRKQVKLDDAKGLKVRVLAGPTQEAEMRAFGVTAVPMPLDQVLPGLQQGAIDGTLTNITVATPLKYNSVAPYALGLNQPYIAVIVIINKQWFDALPADLKKIVADDGEKAGREEYDFMVTYEESQKKAWVTGGGKYVELTPAEHNELMTKVGGIGEDVYKDKPDVLTTYRMVKAVAAKAR